MTVTQTHYDENLSDNTHIKYCKQCRNCVFWGNSDAFSNRHDKSNCDQYPPPGFKPYFVINNTGDCKYRVVRDER